MNSLLSSSSNRNRQLYSKITHILWYMLLDVTCKNYKHTVHPTHCSLILKSRPSDHILCWFNQTKNQDKTYACIDPTLSNTKEPNKISPGLTLSSLWMKLTPNTNIACTKAIADKTKTTQAVIYCIWTRLYSKSFWLTNFTLKKWVFWIGTLPKADIPIYVTLIISRGQKGYH